MSEGAEVSPPVRLSVCMHSAFRNEEDGTAPTPSPAESKQDNLLPASQCFLIISRRVGASELLLQVYTELCKNLKSLFQIPLAEHCAATAADQ